MEMLVQFLRPFLAMTMILASAAPSLALTKAAKYLVKEQIARVCPQGGDFRKAGIIERDVTGDGEPDLILDFSALYCRGASNGINDECGAAHCPVQFYVRQGKLLRFIEEVASIGVDIGKGNPPSITLTNFDYTESTVHWNGAEFK